MSQVRVYATELVCSTEVSGIQTFKLEFCIYNKLHIRTKILSYGLNHINFP